MNAADEALARWIRALPTRWALGGFLLGLAWSLISSLLQGSFLAHPVGGYVAAYVRVFALILLPLSLLGLVWGWTERVGLLRRLASGAQPLQAIDGWVFRQVAKAMLCGALFGAFTYGIGLFRAFRPWDSAEAVTANITGVLGFALLAALLDAIVGVLTRRNLRRRLSGIAFQKAAE